LTRGIRNLNAKILYFRGYTKKCIAMSSNEDEGDVSAAAVIDEYDEEDEEEEVIVAESVEDEDEVMTIKSEQTYYYDEDDSKRSQGGGSSHGKRKQRGGPPPGCRKGRTPAVQGLSIPFRAMKRTMKMDPDIGTVQNEAAIVTTFAAELFVKKLATQSHMIAKNKGRNTIRYEDVAEARTKDPALAFLEMLLP
jgi:histone H3/H4